MSESEPERDGVALPRDASAQAIYTYIFLVQKLAPLVTFVIAKISRARDRFFVRSAGWLPALHAVCSRRAWDCASDDDGACAKTRQEDKLCGRRYAQLGYDRRSRGNVDDGVLSSSSGACTAVRMGFCSLTRVEGEDAWRLGRERFGCAGFP